MRAQRGRRRLEATWHIGALWIDPHDPNVVVVAALGHTFARDADRGIYKTTDGGANWKKTLFKDEETGAIDVAFDAANPKIGFATVWAHYVAPGAAGAILNGTNRVPSTGRPTKAIHGRRLIKAVGCRSIASGARSHGRERWTARLRDHDRSAWRRTVSESDDGGASWDKATADSAHRRQRILQQVYVDPKNADVVYVMQTSMYRSADGGKTFTAWKGAPGGDDDHVLWIDPTHSDWMVMGSNQGAVTSLDGGRTWSSSFQQPTGGCYHLRPDDPLAVSQYAGMSAGRRIDWHAQSRRLREHRHPRSGCRFRRLRVRLHHPRPDQPEHHLRWRRSSRRVAARSREPAGSHGVPQHRPDRRLSHGAQPAACVLATRPARVVRGHAVSARHP